MDLSDEDRADLKRRTRPFSDAGHRIEFFRQAGHDGCLEIRQFTEGEQDMDLIHVCQDHEEMFLAELARFARDVQG